MCHTATRVLAYYRGFEIFFELTGVAFMENRYRTSRTMTDENDIARSARLVSDEMAPATFQDRGISIPFTTPLLSQARLRRNAESRFEFLLPNFTAGKGVYVLPMKGLSSTMTLTMHDRMLFEEIEALESHSPELVRIAVLGVQATGICGADAATHAAELLEQDGQFLVLTQFILVTELLKLVGIGAADLMGPGMTTDDSKRMARKALAKVAGMVGIPPDDLAMRVDDLGAVVAPVGLPQCPRMGRLRQVTQRVQLFADQMQDWSELELSDAGPLGAHCAAVARHTLGLVQQRLTRLDDMCQDAMAIVHDAPRLRGEMADQVTRIAWLLDGWDFLLILWENVQNANPGARREMVGEISRLLPVVPREEVAPVLTAALDIETINRLQRRWVRGNQDWRTGVLDLDAVMRLEAVKAAMA
jgi:hypothetical protein